MTVRQSFLGHDTERLAGGARIFFGAAALAAPYFDPRSHLQVGFIVAVAAYCALGAVVLARQSGMGRPRLAKALHAIDLAFATIMLFAPNGASLFLIMATFCIFSSAIKWRWSVVLLTGAYLLCAYLVLIGVGFVDPERMTIRTAYLTLAPIATALVARSAADARSRLLKLARWSSGRYSASGDAVLRVFRHAADVLEAEHVTVFFHEVDDKASYRARYARASDRLTIEPCEIWPEDATSEELRSQPFLVIDAQRALCLTYSGLKRAPDPTPGLTPEDYGGIIASGPFTGDFCSGRLFATGIKGWRWDQIVLVEIVAAHVRSRLEGRILRNRTARVTAELERMRLSRDLHDGILQSLTAARLQLNALSREAPDLETSISLIANMLQDEQQKLREFIEESRSASVELVSINRIADRIRVVADHWRLKANIEINCAKAEISDLLYREIYFIVGEALANSARHGQATAITARLHCEPGRLTIIFEEEDGQAGSGSYGQVAPRSIAGRIRELGGSLSIARGPTGVTLRVELPTDA